MSSSNCAVDAYTYNVGMLAPSMLIILVLSFMKKRKRIKPEMWNGRPGLPIPVNFLGKESNRLIIVLAFGATASSFFAMFFDSFKTSGQGSAIKDVPHTRYGQAFKGIFMTLLYGIINYPYFACLNAEYRVIGYIMGFLYTFTRCVVQVVKYSDCASEFGQYTASISGGDLLINLPSLICTILLLGSYAFFLFKEIRKTYENNAHPTCREIFLVNWEKEKPVAADSDWTHVSLLLQNKLYRRRILVEYEPWYVTLRRKIYETRPDFKFSTQFLAAIMVSFIFVYQLFVLFIIFLSSMKKLLDAIEKPQLFQQIQKLLVDYAIIAVVVASLIALLQLFMFLKSHRSDVLATYRRRAGQLPDERTNPKVLVGKSLRFCGYQIAFTGIGLLVIALSVLFLLMPILTLKLLDEQLGRKQLLELLKQFILTILPLIIMPVLTWVSLMLLCMFVFRDRTYPDMTVTIDNRRLFDIMSYFFFFLNILVGVWSALSSIQKSAVLGLFFLCRLDRTAMMTGYRKWDRGYMAYIGFLNVLVAFRHPVMLCFCQMLIDKRKAVYSGNPTGGRPCVSTKALNRWFLAVLLIQNPSLLRYRKQNVLMPENRHSITTADTTAVILEEEKVHNERLKDTYFY